MRFNALSIKTKTALAIALGVMALFTLFASTQAYLVRADTKEAIGAQQLAMMARITDDIDEKLLSSQRALARAATATPANLIDNPDLLDQNLESRPGFRSLFDAVIVIGANGRVLVDLPNRGRRGTEVSDRNYFKRTMETGVPQISEPFLSRPANQPTIVITAPILDASGKVIAVVAGTLQLLQPNFLGKLADARVGKTGTFSLIGRDRTIIISRDSSRIMASGPAPGVSPYFDHAVSGGEGWEEEADIGGVHALVSYKALDAAPWILVAAMPVEEAFAPITRAQTRTFQMAALLTLLLSLLAWLGVHRLLAPLSALRDSIARLQTARETFTPVKVVRNDEIGDLARAFNLMMAERHSAETALRTHEAELHAANEASPLGGFRTDARGLCVYVNPAFERISGLTAAQCLGKGWRDAVHPDDRIKVREYVATVAGTKAARQIEHRFQHADGKVVQVLVKTAPILVHGEITGYVSSMDDVTERRANETARRMLASILEASSDFVATTDPTGRVTYINPAGRRLRGIPLDADVSATSISDHYPPWVINLFVKEAIPTAARTGVWTGETAVYDAHGQEIPLSHLVVAHRDPDGEVEYFSGIMRDMTAAHEARQALRASEQRLRLITDNLPALVSYLDRETRFRFANHAYEIWFGIKLDQLYGRTLADFYGEEVFGKFRHHIDAALEGRTVAYEREVAGSGARKHVHVTLVPDHDDAGMVKGLFTLIHDITELKEAELLLEKLARHDGLTGLPNRNHFNDSLDKAIARSRRDGAMALMYLDVDKFKKINDTLGHGAGDEVLKEFATRLSSSIRATDTAARLGGDEFVIILEGLHNPEEAQFVARKILAAIRRPFEIVGQPLQISTSIGIAYLSDEVIDAQALIQRADGALYAAKAAGRDTYQMAKSKEASGISTASNA